VKRASGRTGFEAAIEARGADRHAGFLLPYLRRDMTVLDCGCGEATITIGLAEALPSGAVVGVDLEEGSFSASRGYAASIGQNNLAFTVADARQLPFHDAAFDAVLCHSVLETLSDPARAVAELRRVTKRGGVVGAASVEYGGIILGGEKTAGPQRFYDIRQRTELRRPRKSFTWRRHGKNGVTIPGPSLLSHGVEYWHRRNRACAPGEREPGGYAVRFSIAQRC